jgi:hypothetical protein
VPIGPNELGIQRVIRAGFGRVWGQGAQVVLAQACPNGKPNTSRIVDVAKRLKEAGRTGPGATTVHDWILVNFPNVPMQVIDERLANSERSLTDIFKDTADVEYFANKYGDNRA